MANVQQRTDLQDIGQVDVEELEHAGGKREHQPWERVLFYWLCAGFTAFHLLILTGPVVLRLFDGWFGTGLYRLFPLNIDQELFRAIHLAWGATLGFGFFAIAKGRGTRGVPWYDWLLILAAIGAAAYMWHNLVDLQMNQGAIYELPDLVYSLVGLVVVFEFSRRTAGNALTIIAAVFLLYAVVGHWLPGPLYHDKSLKDLWFAFPYIYSNLGVFGQTLEVSSTFIIMFTAFAAFLTRSKAGEYFNDLSVALVGTPYDTAKNLQAVQQDPSTVSRVTGTVKELGASALTLPQVAVRIGNQKSNAQGSSVTTTSSGSSVTGAGNVRVRATGNGQTDADGRAITRWTLGPKAKRPELSAKVAGTVVSRTLILSTKP